MKYSTPVEIKHIFVSPGHNYFGKPKDGPGEHPTLDVDQAEARSGRGLVGDRYYGVPAHYEAQITFIAWETLQALFEEFNLVDVSPILARRNIVIAGANLNQLIGQEFALDFTAGDPGDTPTDRESERGVVRFLGTKPCSPCAWMDAMFAPGAHEFLRGRGGLRARILSNGILHKGAATLRTDIWIDAARAAAALAKPRLP